MQNLNILIAFMALVMGVLSAPTSNSIKLPRALQAAAPCDAWSEECRDVIQANACFAMYMFNPTTADKSAVLDCVDINDEEVAERKLCNCYGCAETTVQEFAEAQLQCAPQTSTA